MTPQDHDSGSNDLLAGLPAKQLDALLQRAEPVELELDQVIGVPGQRIACAHFPLEGFLTLVSEAGPHQALAVDLVGSEGMVGLPLALGVNVATLRTRVHGAGRALRIGAADFRQVLDEAPALAERLRRYVAVRLTHLGRIALCASFHGVEQRLACWLLMAHDRTRGDRFYLTHDRLAHALGVRRSGVTTAAGVLQAHQWIGYTRGHMVVLDRAGLEGAACSCYRNVHQRDVRRVRALAHRPRGPQPLVSSMTPGPSPAGHAALPATPMPGSVVRQDRGARSRS